MPGRKNKRVSPKPPNVDTIKAMGLPVPEVLQPIKPNGNGRCKRKVILTNELIEKLTSQIADGKSLPTICKQADMPGIVTIFDWLDKAAEPSCDAVYKRLLEKYARAREQQADRFFEEVSDIRDKVEHGSYEAHQARIIFDILRWQAGKLKPSKYGEKLQVEQDTAITIQVVKHTDAITINPGQNALITNNNND